MGAAMAAAAAAVRPAPWLACSRTASGSALPAGLYLGQGGRGMEGAP